MFLSSSVHRRNNIVVVTGLRLCGQTRGKRRLADWQLVRECLNYSLGCVRSPSSTRDRPISLIKRGSSGRDALGMPRHAARNSAVQVRTGRKNERGCKAGSSVSQSRCGSPHDYAHEERGSAERGEI